MIGLVPAICLPARLAFSGAFAKIDFNLQASVRLGNLYGKRSEARISVRATFSASSFDNRGVRCVRSINPAATRSWMQISPVLLHDLPQSSQSPRHCN
mmetsp:Transcript_14504/g.26006  ORF Transcript_14504/g.26006 Transcript_14504/m.26006 type:complete len:98 (-) Transcript_14504:117-410(-)